MGIPADVGYDHSMGKYGHTHTYTQVSILIAHELTLKPNF